MINWGGMFGRRRPAGEPADMPGPGSDRTPPAGDVSNGMPDHSVTGPGSDEVRRMLAESHDNLDTTTIGNDVVPVIVFDGAEFENLERWNHEAAGKRGITTIMTDLNILRDFKGNVFVEVILSFDDDKALKVLISANRHLSFFKTLAASGMLALATDGCEHVITIQLPQPRKAEDALDIIEVGLKPPERGRK